MISELNKLTLTNYIKKAARAGAAGSDIAKKRAPGITKAYNKVVGEEDMNEQIQEFIAAVEAGKAVDSQAVFEEMMAERINAAIDARREVVASQLFTESKEVNELSNDTLGSYKDKAEKNAKNHDKAARNSLHLYNQIRHEKKAQSRRIGISNASDKLTKEDLDEDEVNELSKNTLGNYIKKSAESRARSQVTYHTTTDKNQEDAALKKVVKRAVGVSAAVSKLTK